MAQVLQLRRGTTAQNDAFTGAVAEVSVDTDRDSLRVHDGTTMGGTEIAPLNVAIPLLPDATTVNLADELVVQQGGITKRATVQELANSVPSQLPDATTVNAADELIIQQGGVTKRATATELAKGLDANVHQTTSVGWNTTDAVAPSIWRFKDRVFIGDAADFTGNQATGTSYGNSWVMQDVATYYYLNATLAAAGTATTRSGAGPWTAGVVGVSKWMGVGAICVNDGGFAGYNVGRGLYAEGLHYNTNSNGYTVGIECQVGNMTGTTLPTANAYSMAGSAVNCLFLGAQSGIGYSKGTTAPGTPITFPTQPCGAAIDVSGGVAGASTTSSIVGNGTTATATTIFDHGLETGDVAVVSGASPSGFNGNQTVTKVDATTFTFASSVNATATVQASVLGPQLPFQKFVVGIVFRQSSLHPFTIGATSGVGIVASMAQKHQFNWVTGATGFVGTFIRGQVTGISQASGLVLKNRGGAFVGANYERIVCDFRDSTDGDTATSSVIGNGTTATVITTTAHGLSNGNTVFINGVVPSTFNGNHTVTVVDTTTFTFSSAVNATATSQGSVLVPNRNYLQVRNNSSALPAGIYAIGDSTDVSSEISSKGAGVIRLMSHDGSGEHFRTSPTSAATNYLFARGATTDIATLGTAGTGTNIDLALTPKGTGVLRYGTHAAVTTETVTGYITIKDAAGNTRKLAVVS